VRLKLVSRGLGIADMEASVNGRELPSRAIEWLPRLFIVVLRNKYIFIETARQELLAEHHL